MAAPPKTILILGGSYAGISVAHYALKHVLPALPGHGVYTVTLVSSSSEVFCRPACPRAMISDDMFPMEKLFVSIPKIFEPYLSSFKFIKGTATNLDHLARVVTIVQEGSAMVNISYHALVIATGASTASPLLGLTQDEKFLKRSWETFRMALPNARSIIIGGGGPAGIETAGELGEHLNGRSGFFNPRRDAAKVSVTVVSADTKILPLLRPAIAEQAEAKLAKVGVSILKGVRVVDVAPTGAGISSVDTKATVTLDNGQVLEADIYIPATGTQPNVSFIDKELLASDGRVETSSTTLRASKAGPHVYALGDVASAARPAVHLILDQVPVLCANLKRDLLLEAGLHSSAAKEDRLFQEDMSETQLVVIGKGGGVGAFKGYRMPNFFVWLIKARDYWLWTTGALWNGSHWVKES